MQGVSIVETATLQALIFKVENLEGMVRSTLAELKEAKKPYMTSQELMELTGFTKTWVNDNKAKIGYSTIGTHLRFKRADVEAYIEQNYFKLKTKKLP